MADTQREKSTRKDNRERGERETLLMKTVLSLMALQIEFGWTASKWRSDSRRWVLHHDPGEARLCHCWVLDPRGCCGTSRSHRAARDRICQGWCGHHPDFHLLGARRCSSQRLQVYVCRNQPSSVQHCKESGSGVGNDRCWGHHPNWHVQPGILSQVQGPERVEKGP